MEEFKEIAIDRLAKSPTNPRRRRDPKKFEDLCASVKEKGIIQPIVVRKIGHLWEIVVGEGRYLAAEKVGLAKLPAMVRELSDLDVIEIQLIENKHREDMNVLDEAEGYERLIKGGYSIKRIADRVGLSEKYVYDRIKLLQLIPDAKKLVLSGRITAGHAILVARLKPDDQKRAIDPDTGGLFEHEHLLFDPNQDAQADKLPKEDQRYHELKARSVRELEGWIDEHVRFDRNAPIVQDLFPQTAAAVTDAKDMKLKVIQITHEVYVQPDAKEGNTERIFTQRTWKLADGSSKEAKTCDKWVTGVVVIGPERGAAHKVCVHKECPVHWAKERRERERRSQGLPDAQEKRRAAQQAEERAERERDEQRRRTFDKAKPAIISACVDKIKKAKFGELAQVLYRDWHLKEALKHFPKPRTIEDLGRLVSLSGLIDSCKSWNIESFTKSAKLIGVDVKKLMNPDSVPAETKAQTSAKEKSKVAGGINPNSENAKEKKAEKQTQREQVRKLAGVLHGCAK